MAAPTVVAVSSTNPGLDYGTSFRDVVPTTTIPVPAGGQEGDILCLLVYRSTASTALADPVAVIGDSGWTVIIGSPIDSNPTTVYTYIYWKAWSAGQGPVDITDGNTTTLANNTNQDPYTGNMILVRGADETNPIVQTDSLTVDAKNMTWTSPIATTVDQSLVFISAGAYNNSTHTLTDDSPSLVGFTELWKNNHNADNTGRGAWTCNYGEKATAGALGSFTLTRGGGGGANVMSQVTFVIIPSGGEPPPPANVVEFVSMTSVQEGNTPGGVFTIDCPLPSGLTDGDVLYLGVSRNTKATQSPVSPFSIVNDTGWTGLLNINGAAGRTDMAVGLFLKRYYAASQITTVTIADANTSTAGNDNPLLCFMAAYSNVDVVKAGVAPTGNATSDNDWVIPFGDVDTLSDENLCIGWMVRSASNTYAITSVGNTLSSFVVRMNASGSYGGTNIYYGFYDGEKAVKGNPGDISYVKDGGGGASTMFHIPLILQPTQPLLPPRTSLIT